MYLMTNTIGLGFTFYFYGLTCQFKPILIIVHLFSFIYYKYYLLIILVDFCNNLILCSLLDGKLRLEIADSKQEIVDLKLKIANFQNLCQCCLKSEKEKLPFNLADTLRSFSFSDSEVFFYLLFKLLRG